MPEEPSFLLDEEIENRNVQLAQIAKLVAQKPEKYDPNSVFLKKFLIALYRSGKLHKQLDLKPKEKPKLVVIPKPVAKPVEQVKEQPKKEELPKFEPPKPKIEQPVVETKKEIETPKPQFPEYPLVVSKDTNQTLVKAILRDSNYNLEEPPLSEQDVNLLSTIRNNIGNKLAKNPKLLEDKKYILDNISAVAKKLSINIDDLYLEKIRYYVGRDISGFGRIDSLLKDNDVREIHCDGADKPIEILYKDSRMQTNISYQAGSEVDSLINKFVSSSKEKIKEDQPFVDINMNNLNLKAIRGLGIVSSKFVIKRI